MQFAHNPKLHQTIESSRRKTTPFDSFMPQKNWDFVRVKVVENWGDFRIVWLDFISRASPCNLRKFAISFLSLFTQLTRMGAALCESLSYAKLELTQRISFLANVSLLL